MSTSSNTEFLLFTIAAFVIVGLWRLWRWSVATFDHFRQRNVAYTAPLPLLGNMGKLLATRSSHDLLTGLYESHKHEPYFGFFRFRRPVVCIVEPQLLRGVMVKSFDHFTNHHDNLLPAEQDALFGNALISLKDQKWRDMRSTLSPAFTGHKMRHMYELIRTTTDSTVAELRRASEASQRQGADYVPELKDLFVRHMTDVIASTAFGFETNSLQQRDNVFFTMGQRTINFGLKALLKIGVISWLPLLARLLNVQLFAPSVHRFYHSLVHDTIAERRRPGAVQRPDMIHLLMETRRQAESGEPKANAAAQPTNTDEGAFAVVDETPAAELRANTKPVWTDAELTSQSLLFFLAGFETSSTLLSCVAQELAENPDVQQRLRDEIDAVRNELAADDASVDYERLQRMQYMDMVVSEALRKWPPLHLTDRVCTKPYELVANDGRRLALAVGDSVMVPILGLHRDERNFADPMRFDPERFSAENRGRIEPFTYLPFGFGPRNCIGSRFALITIKSMLFRLLSTFELHVTATTQIPLRLQQRGFSFVAIGGFNVQLRPRTTVS